jgi:hypothetical protein
MNDKTRLIPVTDGPEIAAVQAGAAGDLGKPFGVQIGEAWYARGGGDGAVSSGCGQRVR